MIVEAIRNVRPKGSILRLRFISTPPEWSVSGYISPYHYIRVIQDPALPPANTWGNGKPNQSIEWMKAMAIVNIKKVVLHDYNASLLEKGEKIMVTYSNPPPPENCDFCTALIRNEVDCSLATTKWMEKIEREKELFFLR